MGRILAKQLEGDGYDAVLWGTVSQPPTLQEVGEKKTPKVKFSLAYAKGQFMNCVAWSNNETSQTAVTLHKGDRVLVAGTWAQRSFTGNDGKPRTVQEITCDLVIPQAVIALALLGPPYALPDNAEAERDSSAYQGESEQTDYIPQV